MIISHNQSSNNQNLSVGDDTRQHMLLDMVNEGAAKLNGCLYCSLTHEFSSATIEEVCENYCGNGRGERSHNTIKSQDTLWRTCLKADFSRSFDIPSKMLYNDK